MTELRNHRAVYVARAPMRSRVASLCRSRVFKFCKRVSKASRLSTDNRPGALSGPCDRSLTRILRAFSRTFVTFRATKELFHIARMRQVRRVTWPNFEIADQFASHVPGVWSNRTIVLRSSRLVYPSPGDLRVRTRTEVTYLPMGDRLGPLNGPCDRDLTRISRLNFFYVARRKKFYCIAWS